MIRLFGVLLFLLSITGSLAAQVLPVGTPALEDYYRRLQLEGKIDSSLSFMVRPLDVKALGVYDVYTEDSTTSSFLWENKRGDGHVQLQPVVLEQQFNSTYPYGWNDGGMIPARGYQLMASAGFHAKYKWLSVQLRPEFVVAENRIYEGYGGETGPDQTWYQFIGNVVDRPELFGNGSYSRVNWGQSNIRLTYDPISIGLSTENLWWGPGIRNSLMMSNTAGGFPHLTLNTTLPIRTYIGSFEGQVVGGRLDQSGYPPSLLGSSNHQERFYRPRVDDWRYFSGMTLTYQPKWVPGLFLGLSRTYIADYRHLEGGSWRNYFPFFETLQKSRGANEEGEFLQDSLERDQLISLFFKWVIPKAKAEIYFEYGRNDHSWDSRDMYTQLDHSRAYLIGVRKLVDLSPATNTSLQIAAEVTQLAMTNTRALRPAETWYSHYQVRDGYTQRGQVLGAGIGPGSNIQSLDVSWIRGIKQIGVQLERLVHNEDFVNWGTWDYRRKWVDGSIAGYAVWDYGQFLATLQLRYVHAFNYQYGITLPASGEDYWDYGRRDKGNFHGRLGVMYRF